MAENPKTFTDDAGRRYVMIDGRLHEIMAPVPEAQITIPKIDDPADTNSESVPAEPAAPIIRPHIELERRDEMLQWASEQMDGATFRDDAITIAYVRGDTPMAVAVFDTHSPTGCVFHIATDGEKRWAARGFIVRALTYPFIECRYPRITAFISENNLKSIELATHFPWEMEGSLRKAGMAGENVAVLGMLREDWLRSPWSSKGRR